MYHATRNLQVMLEAFELPPGQAPDSDGAGPDPLLDAYLFDASRRLAVLLVEEADGDPTAVGRYARQPIEDRQAEEVARAVRTLCEIAGEQVRSLGPDERERLVAAVADQVVREREQGDDAAESPVRARTVETALRQALEHLQSA